MTQTDELLEYVFDGARPALYPAFENWVQSSRRFKAFCVSNRSKIKAKLKHARDDGGVEDLAAELETAALLLGDERFTIEYERYAAMKQRGPDLTVTFKTHTPFNVEVRRLRMVELRKADAPARTTKLMAVLCEKVGQMPPSIVNLLWLKAEGEISEADVAGAARTLRQLAGRKAEEYFTRWGWQSAAAFDKQYRRLSGIVPAHAGRTELWLNPLARHPVPPEIVRAIRRLEGM